MRFLDAAKIIKYNFSQELRDAVAEKPTSLRFIKHLLPHQPLIKDGEIFQVLVVGGTVFKKALVKKENGQINILGAFSEEHLALSSKELLLKLISNNIYPETSSAVINFAFPLKPLLRNGRMDGILLSAAKAANTLNGLINHPVGEAIESHLLEQKGKKLTVITVNDVICLLFSGLTFCPKDFLAGAIMGTGTNNTFFHNDIAINTQSGGFDKFTLTEECRQIDMDSSKPGSSLFEKETAGGYLYKQFNYHLVKNKINYPLLKSTKELGDLISSHPKLDSGSYQVWAEIPDQIRKDILDIARSLFEKSAAYFAGQIAGLAAFKMHDMKLIIEGSVYWENPLYKNFFNEYLELLSPDIKIEIKKVQNSSIIGAARLVT